MSKDGFNVISQNQWTGCFNTWSHSILWSNSFFISIVNSQFAVKFFTFKNWIYETHYFNCKSHSFFGISIFCTGFFKSGGWWLLQGAFEQQTTYRTVPVQTRYRQNSFVNALQQQRPAHHLFFSLRNGRIGAHRFFEIFFRQTSWKMGFCRLETDSITIGGERSVESVHEK